MRVDDVDIRRGKNFVPRPLRGTLLYSSFTQMQKHIADSYAEYMAGKYYVYGVAANLDLASVGNGLDADGTKLFCTSMAKNVADRAMQVCYRQ